MRHNQLDSYPTANADDYDRELHSLLNAAIDLPSAQVRPFLERTAGCRELALEVEGLLQEQTSQDDFLRSPLVGFVSWTAKLAA